MSDPYTHILDGPCRCLACQVQDAWIARVVRERREAMDAEAARILGLTEVPPSPVVAWDFTDLTPPDPYTQPLPTAPPDTWEGRQQRVEWLMRNLTPGEKAMFYRRLNAAPDHMRVDRCGYIESEERKSLQPRKERWP